MSSQWQKGESGNKKGRPPKSRILAQTLRETGTHDSFGELSNQQLLARMVWEGLAMGTVTFVGGRTLELDGREWLELVKWVHSHVDGSYRPEPDEREDETVDAPQKLVLLYGPERLTFDEMMAEGRREREAEEARQAVQQAEADLQVEAARQMEIARQNEEVITIPPEKEAAPILTDKVEFALSEML